ncbi:unnamed protein product [Brugia pahangi]|uniref:Secreted protein n=1 Tax=Brugia pahangi TaxID=6280 RepID=A0A0N4TGF6_BRUPA|nr:unnamed protein product [Brugia pahangi]
MRNVQYACSNTLQCAICIMHAVIRCNAQSAICIQLYVVMRNVQYACLAIAFTNCAHSIYYKMSLFRVLSIDDANAKWMT